MQNENIINQVNDLGEEALKELSNGKGDDEDE